MWLVNEYYIGDSVGSMTFGVCYSARKRGGFIQQLSTPTAADVMPSNFQLRDIRALVDPRGVSQERTVLRHEPRGRDAASAIYRSFVAYENSACDGRSLGGGHCNPATGATGLIAPTQFTDWIDRLSPSVGVNVSDLPRRAPAPRYGAGRWFPSRNDVVTAWFDNWWIRISPSPVLVFSSSFSTRFSKFANTHIIITSQID